MKKKLSKPEAKKEIETFLKNIKDKNPKEIKKTKRLAMAHNIKLGEKRKTFCKKCFYPYKKPKIRIKNKTKTVWCKNCGYVSKWRLK